MKVILVNPPVSHGKYKSKQSSIPPAGPGYLSAQLENNGIPCDIIDGKLEELSLDEVSKGIEVKRPDIVGLSAMTSDMFAAGEIARKTKETSSGSMIVLGGPHATAIPEETLREFPEIDFVVSGEGEETIVELIRSMGGDINYHGINGLGFRDNAEIIVNSPRDYIKDLDRLPFPAWDKFLTKSRTYFILSARGCPYRCSFCMRSLGSVVRERSPENVVDEIEWIVKKYNPKQLIFIDETFTLKKNRVIKITDLIINRELNRELRWVAQTRADRGDKEVFSMMKKAGCEKIEFGIESGNQDILNYVDKDIKLSKIEEVVRLAKNAGLQIACSFILGHPYETEETIQDTINIAVKLNPNIVSFGVMSPYPGTKIWEMAKVGEGNYKLLSHNWEDFVRFGGGTLELTNLSRHRLEILQLKAYIHFFVRTFKIIKFLQYALPRLSQSKAVIKKFLISVPGGRKVKRGAE